MATKHPVLKIHDAKVNLSWPAYVALRRARYWWALWAVLGTSSVYAVLWVLSNIH